MQSGIENNLIICKLQNNEDLFESLNYLIKKYNINSGLILTGIGMLKEFELGYFDPGGYKTKFFQEPHELISLSGSIAINKEDPTEVILHVHCSVADRENQLWGGHLHKAKVNVVNEITIFKLEELQLNRIKNDSTGLMELNVEGSTKKL
jgi:predicted DNA-binding protein with PD1-like motif